MYHIAIDLYVRIYLGDAWHMVMCSVISWLIPRHTAVFIHSLLLINMQVQIRHMYIRPEAPETVRGKGGRLTLEGHDGWSTVWGLGGGQNSKHSKNRPTIMTLLLM